jgi:hypothetical protein
MIKWLAIGLLLAFLALGTLTCYALWQGAALGARVVGVGIAQARAALEEAAPPEARERARARIDAALAALRDGRLEPAQIRETALSLAGALADGRLDAGEREALWRELDRLAPEPAPPSSPAG